ncbi:beta-methylgalactoside transporter permease, partial [uncultured Haemophilus sp.]|uniref:ABC transporter permease subunit n=1 Tax=uncultured Haemophilus sp. TaxID=237779 RepID=UPI0025F8C080
MSALPKNKSFDFLKQNAIYFVLLILLGIIIAQDPTFLNVRNFSNILTQSSVRLIIALGVAGLLITQGTDLSAGRQVGLAAVISATLLQSMENMNRVFPDLGEIPIPVVILTVCAVGAVIGLVNGLVIAYLNVTPFIATMGTMQVFRGVAYVITGGYPVLNVPRNYRNVFNFKITSVMTFAVVIFFLFAIVITFVLKKTKIGAYTYAVGGNEDAARLSGVRVERTKALIYGIGMLGTTLAALVMIGRLGTGDPSTGQGYEMDAIAAAAIGGTSMAGGRGNI